MSKRHGEMQLFSKHNYSEAWIRQILDNEAAAEGCQLEMDCQFVTKHIAPSDQGV